jgi:hypothetical protein
MQRSGMSRCGAGGVFAITSDRSSVRQARKRVAASGAVIFLRRLASDLRAEFAFKFESRFDII